MLETPQSVPTSTSFHGAMRVLHDLGADDGLDTEDNDPIKRQVLTLGEARRAFKTSVSCQLSMRWADAQFL